MKFRKLADGMHIEIGGGVEIVRTLDDSDGYCRTEWTVWTANRGRCVAMVPTFAEAKTRARKLRADGVI